MHLNLEVTSKQSAWGSIKTRKEVIDISSFELGVVINVGRRADLTALPSVLDDDPIVRPHLVAAEDWS